LEKNRTNQIRIRVLSRRVNLLRLNRATSTISSSQTEERGMAVNEVSCL